MLLCQIKRAKVKKSNKKAIAVVGCNWPTELHKSPLRQQDTSASVNRVEYPETQSSTVELE